VADLQTLRLVALGPGMKARGAYRAVVGETRHGVGPGGCELVDQVVTPDGTRLIVLGFHGDVAGWQGLVEANAARLRLVTGAFEGDRLVLSDERTFDVRDCAGEDL
jgi:hypothetical protein